MGCWYSRLDREEMVSRCKARTIYIKQLVKARQSLSACHVMYVRSLRNTGSALLQFATAETTLHHHPPSNPSPPPPPRPISWTTTTTTSSSTTSSAIRPPPPPPPVPSGSTWDFWDPFMPTSGRSVDEDEWEDTASASEMAATASEMAATATTTTTPATANGAGPPSVVTTTDSSQLAVVLATKSKGLVEIIQELDDYFTKAANAAAPLSLLLEVPVSNFTPQRSSGKDFVYNKSSSALLWNWGSSSGKWNAFGKLCEDPIDNNVGCMAGDVNATHCSTVERLCAWEKKLYQEVKNAAHLKIEHEKKTAILRKLEMKNADYIKAEKAKKEAEKLESQMMVAFQAIETTSMEIIRLRESELYPQLFELVKGLTSMWRSMYESHHVQTHIVQQLKYLNFVPSTEPTSEIHRQSTLQLELEAHQWHLSFCNLMKAQRDYIQSLTGWLRLSLFQVGNNPVNKTTKQHSEIYPFCEEWQLAINNAPDKVASEGIKSFLTVIHAIVVQQADEQKQKRRSELVSKNLNKKSAKLRSLESKHDPYSTSDGTGETIKDPKRAKVEGLRTKVEGLRAKAADEKAKYEKLISVSRAMTMNNLQMGLPHVFQAMTGFANVYKQAFESVHNQAKSVEDLHNVKMILP